MSRRLARSLLVVLACSAAMPAPAQPADEDLDALQEAAIKAAVRKVAPTVVQIETQGGTDVLGAGPRGPQLRKGMGPTSGVVVSADGHVITSAFNFANKPATIYVGVPSQRERYVAKVVATDQTRMLTLLKVDAKDLPVPQAAPKKGIAIGQTAIALGRTLDALDRPPSVSVGIISALNRIWGKALQTDAKVSPVNYGGPLIDLEGRVLGILVPAAPRGDNETAGVEWYDGGIGFAIPLEDVLAVLPRLKEGKDLYRGVVGILSKTGDLYGEPPTVDTVSPGSAGAKAGIKPDDVIIEIDGKPVASQAQMQHILGPKYQGDTVTVKVRRDKEELTFAGLTLGGPNQPTADPFLGILPVRDDPEPGVEVRYVFPKSPADTAGIKAGDRIMGIDRGMGRKTLFTGRDALALLLANERAGASLTFDVKRKDGGKTEAVTLRLGEYSDVVPDELPKLASAKKAQEAVKQPAPMRPMGPMGRPMPRPMPMPMPMPEEKKPPKKAETGLLERSNAVGDRQYWVYVPKEYDANIRHSLVIWLHPVGKGKKEDVEDFTDTWADYCAENHLILLCPKADNATGWVGSEAEFIREAVQDVIAGYMIDRRRVVVHGMGQGGQMAFYLGFQARDLVRAVAATGAVLANQVKEKERTRPLGFFVAVGSKDPLAAAIGDTKAKLSEAKYPLVFREIANLGHQYLDLDTLDELVRWIDSLDRM